MKILLAGVLLAGAALAAGDDWPRFRGPDGAGLGVAPNLPLPLTAANQLWNVKLPGVGHSSPVVVGARLFVTCGENATAKRIVLCLDAATGRTLWQREFPSTTYRQNNDNSYATASPAADADGVVVTWTTPEEVLVVAFDNDGKEKWRRGLGPFICNHGSGSSPIIVGGLVVLANEQDNPKATPQNYDKPDSPKVPGKSFVIALDRQTGTTRWQLDRISTQAAFATPCVRYLEGGVVELVCANSTNGLTGVDVATGKINWVPTQGFRRRCVGSPACGAGLVVSIAGSGGMGAELVAVKPGAKPEVAFSMTKPLPYVPTPLFIGDKLILWGDNGQVTCLRAATGEILWREKVEGTFYSSPIAVNGRVINVSKTGDLITLVPGDKFETPARLTLGEKSFATPAIAGGKLFIHTYTQLFAFGSK
ncbi:MAG: PQQ-binding-like beta-propeller repeat protein [Kiritimatiellaeota bacterium]|nr:PQQ-binding-like beta-propeller repeat protein [Kiritimatiellota bacterium]